MGENRAQRRLAAILAADVVGYSRLMEADETGTLSRLKALRREIIDPSIASHSGRIVKLMGDGALVEFISAVDAVGCAVEIQNGVREHNAKEASNDGIWLRIGINVGDIIVEDDDIYGDGVNIAARLESIAEPGGIMLSGMTFDHVKGKVDVAFDDIGPQSLKNIAQLVRAYRVAGASPTTNAVSKPASNRPSIAVLPFSNMSTDPEQEYFSDGISEDIITELSRFHSLSVIARNSSFSFKGRSVDIAEIGRALGVRYVVEGSVRKVGRRVRITAQLIEAASGGHIWAERYDRDIEEIFAVQDEVTERIVWALTGKIAVAEIARSKQGRVGNLEAYDLVLRGDDLINRYTSEDTAAAIDLIKKASELDPNTGWVLSWLSRAYVQAGFLDFDERKFDLAVEAAEQALVLGNTEDWTDAIVAYVLGWRRKFQEAEIRVSRALARNPHDAQTAEVRIYVLLWSGQIKKSLEIAERVVRLDPVNPLWFHEFLSYAYYLLGDYGGSLQAFRRSMPVGYYRGYAYFAACLGQLGRIEEAQAAWRRCLELRPGFSAEEFDRSSPYERAQHEHWLDGLRKAELIT